MEGGRRKEGAVPLLPRTTSSGGGLHFSWTTRAVLHRHQLCVNVTFYLKYQKPAKNRLYFSRFEFTR